MSKLVDEISKTIKEAVVLEICPYIKALGKARNVIRLKDKQIQDLTVKIRLMRERRKHEQLLGKVFR